MSTRSKFPLESIGSSLALSILFNIILVILTSLIIKVDIKSPPTPSKKRQAINIKSFRTVGVKDGNKKNFSIPTEKASPPPQRKLVGNTEVRLDQLGSVSEKESIESAKRLSKPIPTEYKNKDAPQFSFSSKPPLEQRLQKQQKQLQGDVLKSLAANPSFANALNNKGFNVQFDPPEGIKEDELNSIEKIFYSFQKRTYETYLNSFLKTYYNTLTSNPNLRSDLVNSKHRLNARVQFDRNGNILSVKILKSSPSDLVHQLFETTLDMMRSIPNPPKDLLGKDGNFTIYYSLYIN